LADLARFGGAGIATEARFGGAGIAADSPVAYRLDRYDRREKDISDSGEREP
jgi:hypothetical protein